MLSNGMQRKWMYFVCTFVRNEEHTELKTKKKNKNNNSYWNIRCCFGSCLFNAHCWCVCYTHIRQYSNEMKTRELEGTKHAVRVLQCLRKFEWGTFTCIDLAEAYVSTLCLWVCLCVAKWNREKWEQRFSRTFVLIWITLREMLFRMYEYEFEHPAFHLCIYIYIYIDMLCDWMCVYVYVHCACF